MENEEDNSVSDTKEEKPLEIIDSVFLTQQKEDAVEDKSLMVINFELLPSSTRDDGNFKTSSKSIQSNRSDVEAFAKNDPDNNETCKQVHNKQRRFKCNECEKAYFNGRQLKRHQRSVHKKEIRFNCSSCDYGTYYKQCLEGHVAIHTLHKRFKCDICSYSCYKQGDLITHKKRHRGVRSHKCHECGSAFTISGHLKDHILAVHRKVKRFKCSICGFGFYFVNPLKNHLAAHFRNGITRGQIIDLQKQKDKRFYGDVEENTLNNVDCGDWPKKSEYEQLSTTAKTTSFLTEETEAVTQHQENNELSAARGTKPLCIVDCVVGTHQSKDQGSFSEDIKPMELDRFLQQAKISTGKKSVYVGDLNLLPQQVKDVPEIHSLEIVDLDLRTQQVADVPKMKSQEIVDLDLHTQQEANDPEMKSPEIVDLDLRTQQVINFPEMKSPDILDFELIPQQVADDLGGKEFEPVECPLVFHPKRDESCFDTSSTTNPHRSVDGDPTVISRSNILDNVKTRKRVHTRVKRFKCNECEKAYFTVMHLKIHQRSVHRKEIRFTCSYCNYGTFYKQCLEGHVAIHTLHKRYKCDICSYSCYKKGDLTTHKKMHSGENRRHVCNECGKVYTSSGHLKDHQLSAHEKEKRFKCLVCGYGTYFKKHLEVHMAAHNRKNNPNDELVNNKVKPFRCNQCTKSFAQDASLRRHHLTVHKKETRFNCSACDYATYHKEHLNLHFATHTQEKTLKCNDCDYSTYRSSSLRRHALVHSKEKPYECGECGQKYAQRSSLKGHQLAVHKREKRHRCPLCGFATYYMSSLKSHIARHSS